MDEFRDVRSIVALKLRERGLDPFVYEREAGARPEPAISVVFEEVEKCDLFVAIFGQQWGTVTIQEFGLARKLQKPCLVYIRDRDAIRDERLHTWLKENVFDLQKGVRYAFFDSSVEFATQAADDTLAWLVRRHREATAEMEHARLSGAEVERLKGEVERLQSLTTGSLPHGAETDYFAHTLRAWFKTLGYGLESHERRDEDGFEWIINIPSRRGYDRVGIVGVPGEGKTHHWLRLSDLTELQGLSEGWLISARRISPAVRDRETSSEYAHLDAYSLDELIDQCADFSSYLKWLEHEIVERGIDRHYVQLACTKEEFDPRTGHKIGQGRYDLAKGGIDGYIDQWVEDPSKEHISVLGEFGTGKTWFTLHYAWLALRRYTDAKARGVERPRVPLLIPLRDYAKAVTVESLFSEFFFRRHEIPLPGYSAFEQLNRMGKLLLIFDGFDEMAARVDREAIINNFWQLARVVGPGAKAILTCRSEHFPDAKQGRALLNAELRSSTAQLTGEAPQFEVLELEKFNDEQIRHVLSQRAKPATVSQIMNDPELLDLVRRPVMTDLVVDALPDIEQGKPVDLPRIYLYAVRHKMERDIRNGRTFTSLADKLYFLCELSWEMLTTDTMSLNYRRFPELLSRLFGSIVAEEKDLDRWKFDMHGQTMLIRNADGDYYPAHRSLLEFFVAYRLAAHLGLLPDDFTEMARAQMDLEGGRAIDQRWSEYFVRGTQPDGSDARTRPLRSFRLEQTAQIVSTFGRKPLTKAVLELLLPIISTSQENAVQRLKNLVRQTVNVSERSAAFVGSNAASLLVKIQPTTFRASNLCDAVLPNVDFTMADLAEAQLKRVVLRHGLFRTTDLKDADLAEADLRNAVFHGVNFEGTNLSGANLRGAEFSDFGSVASVAISEDDELIASGGADGSITIWNRKTGIAQKTLRGHRAAPRYLTWAPNGALLASWSTEAREIIIWDTERGTNCLVIGSGFPALTAAVLQLRFTDDSEHVMLRTAGDAWMVAWKRGATSLHRETVKEEAPGVVASDHWEVALTIKDVTALAIVNKAIRVPLTGTDTGVADYAISHSRTWAILGTLDGRMLLVDVRPLLLNDGRPELLKGSGHRQLVGDVGEDRETWPHWCRQVWRDLPSGWVPNPSFGEIVQVIEPRLNCHGMRLDNVVGLRPEVADWLVKRGALLPQGSVVPTSSSIDDIRIDEIDE